MTTDYPLVKPADLKDGEFYWVRRFADAQWLVGMGYTICDGHRMIRVLRNDVDADTLDEIRGPIVRPERFQREMRRHSWEKRPPQ